jgi:hypothetical protein
LQCSAFQGDIIQRIHWLGAHAAQNSTALCTYNTVQYCTVSTVQLHCISSAFQGHSARPTQQLLGVTRVRVSRSHIPAMTPAVRGHTVQPLEDNGFLPHHRLAGVATFSSLRPHSSANNQPARVAQTYASQGHISQSKQQLIRVTRVKLSLLQLPAKTRASRAS